MSIDDFAKSVLNSGQATIDEPPPSMSFRIDWATPDERKIIIERNYAEGRQIMNLTLNPSAKLLVLHEVESEKIVGWCGVDVDSRPTHPESFSCYLEPAYRHYLLWLVLEHARCDFANSRGLKNLFVRMNAIENNSLLEKRIDAGIYQKLDAPTMGEDFLSDCHRCGLYAKTCLKQAYLSVSVEKMLQHVHQRMGLTESALPRFVVLKKEMMRSKAKIERFVPAWTDANRLKTPEHGPFRATRLFSTFGIVLEPTAANDPMSLSRDTIREKLKEHGLVLFRGFNFDDDLFRKFSDSFMVTKLTHGSANRNKVSADGTVVEVVKGQMDMPLHMELGYVPWSPDLVWFHCKIPPEIKGQTTAGDAGQIASRLSAPTRKLLEKNKIRYDHSWMPQDWKGFLQCSSLSEAIEKLQGHQGVRVSGDTSEDILRFTYTAPALRFVDGRHYFLNSLLNMAEERLKNFCRLSFEDGSPIPSEVIGEIRRTCDELTENIDWRPGDAALIDNHRVLHGRRAFEGQRLIHVRFGNAA